MQTRSRKVEMPNGLSLGLGEFLLMDALHRCLDAAVEIAAMAVIVDAKDAAAVAFYARYGFLPLQQQPSRLFLPMKTVADLFPERNA
jgi:hypothetical protein